MSQNTAIVARADKVLIGNYARQPVVMVRGEGCRLWDADGKEYLDLFAGFGGGVLGHCQPDLVAAVKKQAETLWHVGNLYHTEPQVRLAEALNRTAFPGRAFFCHGGADANEAAIKLGRLRGNAHSPKRWKTISLTQSFHGRTLATIAATGNPAVRAGFAPDVPGFVNVEQGNFDALAAAVDDETASILMEPVQGEGGVNLYPPDYAARVRELCDQRGLTLIFDEVWTGCGRTGKWFGHQWFEGNVVPDVMTLGKAVGGGLPVGVMFARPEVADLMVPGTHGSTLGGNPICAAAAAEVFHVIERDGLLSHAAKLGDHAMARLRDEPSIREKIADVRGRGLFIGVELRDPPERFAERTQARGLIVNLTAKKVIRLAPPINISPADWDRGLDEVIEVIASL